MLLTSKLPHRCKTHKPMNFYITSENAQLELNRLYGIRNWLNDQVLLCETLDKPTWVSIYNDRLVNVNENIKQVVDFLSLS